MEIRAKTATTERKQMKRKERRIGRFSSLVCLFTAPIFIVVEIRRYVLSSLLLFLSSSRVRLYTSSTPRIRERERDEICDDWFLPQKVFDYAEKNTLILLRMFDGNPIARAILRQRAKAAFVNAKATKTKTTDDVIVKKKTRFGSDTIFKCRRRNNQRKGV